MDSFLQVHKSGNPGSPTNSFTADEVASICPLITPSPPPNDFINPLQETSESDYKIGEELATMLQHCQDKETNVEDSASSNSSVMAEPACTQLLNHRNSYFHIQKDEHTANEETTGKVQPLQLTFKNPPENYFFMSWNWSLIRRICLWIVLASLAAIIAIVIAMIYSLPKTCNPQTEWYQGSVMYEIFPTKYSENGFKGIALSAPILKEQLEIRSIRLNSIFATPNYPYDYKNVTSLITIATKLGNSKNFRFMIHEFHRHNISVILDLPIYPLVKQLVKQSTNVQLNDSRTDSVAESLTLSDVDLVEDALFYWTHNHDVDGFYLKGLENLVDDPNLRISLRRWKKVVGERPLIVHEDVINNAHENVLDTILYNVALVDVHLKIEKDVGEISRQILSILNGTLFTRPGSPWILWNIGDESTTSRLADILPYGNATLGATLLQMMLPGTPSIYYGNERGLHLFEEKKNEKEDGSYMQNEQSAVNSLQIEAIKKMVKLRQKSPAIYVNTIYKEGESKANAEVMYSTDHLLVIQRWFPRRKSYVVVANLGTIQTTADLSTLLYSGEIVIGPRADSKSGSVSFKNISLWPGESVIIQLD